MLCACSRSHAIFTIFIDQVRKSGDSLGSGADAGVLQLVEEEHLTAKMHLVDLAGSERIKRTKAEGLRMQEGEKRRRGREETEL